MELEEDRLRKIEDERIANLRPPKMGKIAIVRLYDTFINFQAVTLNLDLNNTTIKQLRSALSKKLGVQPKDTPMASTNAFSPDEVMTRTRNSRSNVPLAFDSANRFTSVLDGKKHGQSPAVGVAPDQRSTLTDDLRLADIKGRVIVYIHPNPLPRTTFAEQLKEYGIEAAIEIFLG